MDPLQLMMLQATNSNFNFPEASRYRTVEIAYMEIDQDRRLAYLQRRFLPQPESMATLTQHVVVPNERLDNLAAQYLGNPELFWRICDANREMRPADLTDEPENPSRIRTIRVALPPGVPAPEM